MTHRRSAPRWLLLALGAGAAGAAGPYAVARAGPDARPTSAPAASASSSTSPEAPEIAFVPPGGEVVSRNVEHRPDGDRTRRCSTERRVCVHVPAEAQGAHADAALEVAERALTSLAALRLPGPRDDGALGGDGRLDIYLEAERTRAEARADIGSTGTGFDRASAFVVAPHVAPESCIAAQGIARAIGGAALLGQDAALEPGTLRMLSDYLGVVLEPCAVSEAAGVDAAQRRPEATFVGAAGEGAAGSFLFPWFLEDRYGTGEPGKLTMALAAISTQASGAGPLVDEPDPFDALRITQQKNGTSLADTLLEFAVARAFVGSRSDEAHMVDVAKYGPLGRVRFDWSVPHGSLPRRLAQVRAVEPLGAAYLWVDLEGVSDTAEITFVAEWEEPVAFRWALVKIAADGSAAAQIDAVPVLGETKILKTVQNLTGSRGLLIVGVNEGEARRDEPFDPGRAREDAHGYLVTLYP